MSKKKKPKIVAVSMSDKEKLIEMGNKVRDGFAIRQHFASDFFYYEEYDEPIIPKKTK
jgi:hypothetical protein